jgi:outer membrane lipoprotein-sorting protein
MKISLQKDNRGIAHLALILGVVVIAIIGGVGYMVYSRQSSDNHSAMNMVSNKEVEAACNKEIDDNNFCKFASGWTDLVNYKAVTTSTSKDGTSVMTLEAENKEKSHMLITTNGKDSSEAITIGNSTYIKDYSDNKWTKFTTSESTKTEDIKSDIDVDFKESTTAETDKTQYKLIGKEACGSLTCFKYQIIDPKDPGSEQFVWFDTKDYMLRRWSTKDANGTSDTVFTYDSIKISEPSPVKEAAKIDENTSASDLQAAADAMMHSQPMDGPSDADNIE